MQEKEKHTKSLRDRAVEAAKKGGLDIVIPEEDVIFEGSFKEKLKKAASNEKPPQPAKKSS